MQDWTCHHHPLLSSYTYPIALSPHLTPLCSSRHSAMSSDSPSSSASDDVGLSEDVQTLLWKSVTAIASSSPAGTRESAAITAALQALRDDEKAELTTEQVNRALLLARQKVRRLSTAQSRHEKRAARRLAEVQEWERGLSLCKTRKAQAAHREAKRIHSLHHSVSRSPVLPHWRQLLQRLPSVPSLLCVRGTERRGGGGRSGGVSRPLRSSAMSVPHSETSPTSTLHRRIRLPHETSSPASTSPRPLASHHHRRSHHRPRPSTRQCLLPFLPSLLSAPASCLPRLASLL